MLEMTEPVNVWVLFRGNQIEPHTFFWRNRKIKIDQVNLMHSTKDGGKLFYHFSISSGGNFYRLRFDLAKMKWFLEAVEEG